MRNKARLEGLSNNLAETLASARVDPTTTSELRLSALSDLGDR